MAHPVAAWYTQSISGMNTGSNNQFWRVWLVVLGACLMSGRGLATPANRATLEKHYGRFLTSPLARCTTCHLPSAQKFPESLDEFPHNSFGDRLRKLGEELGAAGKKNDLQTRLSLVAQEDTDGDGVPNETELLLGHNPGDAKDTPSALELAAAATRHTEFAAFLKSYRWQPLDPVVRPPVPAIAISFPLQVMFAYGQPMTEIRSAIEECRSANQS